MSIMYCDQCGKEIVVIEDVTAFYSRGYWWCARHANLVYVDGIPVVQFPSDGKLIPQTILTEKETDAQS